jgi:hypothetical protein
MSGIQRNEGIHISGGRFEAGTVAVGRGARARTVAAAPVRGGSELTDRLDELLRQLEAHASQLTNGDELRDSTRAVADELAREKPNRTTLVGILTGIATGGSSVAAIVTAAEKLIQAVQRQL